MLTYLLISSGSSSATRVDDWKSNWGADKFPQLAKTSVDLVPIAVIARTRNIDEENRTTKDFLILRPMKSHLKKQNSSLVHTDVQNWDAELYVKVDNNIKLDLVSIIKELPSKYSWSTREYYGTGIRATRIKTAPVHAFAK
ncbi:hypothetical protein L2E82_47851 [Cichorium intybus]|uniref:Uncharacterized protein n=1 Tax=Cichorium intybus TaxID=13427 RepID=A0ACB8YXD9_CICIN|nr:hypothetical protein L2E82_47851 [Cichorium intybus]